MLPCGKCESCLKRRKKEWTSRLIAESQLHGLNSFVTLTYATEYLPLSISEGYRDVQLWLKTLRNRKTETLTYFDGNKITAPLPPRFRYFVSGEWGPAKDRLHWHCVLFGIQGFPKGKTISETWTKGFVTWEDATVSRMAYAACYVTKKTDQHENFFRYSKNPALGNPYFVRLGKQAFSRSILPQTIQLLEIGNSRFPLSRGAKEAILSGFYEEAAVHNQLQKAMEDVAQLDVQNRLQRNFKQDLIASCDDGLWRIDHE